MDGDSWELRGVDPETRRHAAEEAARRGISVADYLTEVLLAGACADYVLDEAAELPPAPRSPVFDPPSAMSESFSVQHRFDLLRRQFSHTVNRLDGGLDTLGGAVDDLASRLEDAEALSADTADTLQRALQDIRTAVAALTARCSNAEESVHALSHGNREDHEGLDQRLAAVESSAQLANASVAALTKAQDALKRAVASDFSELAEETAQRVHAGLEDVRAAADAAARQADAAVTHLVRELAAVRQALEGRLADNATESREHMRAAFSEFAARLDALGRRVSVTENGLTESANALRERITEAERGLQDGLLALSSALRQTDAALSSETVRVSVESRTALEALRAELEALRELRSGDVARSAQLSASLERAAAGLSVLREHTQRELTSLQTGWKARLESVQSALDEANLTAAERSRQFAQETAQALALLRHDLEVLHADHARALSDGLGENAAQAQRDLSRAHADWDSRFDAAAARVARVEREALQARDVLAADTARVEACTLAALEKLAADVAATRGHAEAVAEETRDRIDEDLDDLRERQTTLAYGLARTDEDLAKSVEAADVRLARLETEAEEARQTAARLALLEDAASRAETEQALAIIREQMAALGAAQLSAQQTTAPLAGRIETLSTRLAAFEKHAHDNAAGVRSLASALDRHVLQTAELAAQSEARLAETEAMLASRANDADLAAIQRRLDRLDERHADTLDTLREQIAQFIAENEQRLAQVEAAAGETADLDMLAFRMERLEQRDLAADFEALRQRIEDRIIGLEDRSIRALEQVGETIALLERRMLEADLDRDAKSA